MSGVLSKSTHRWKAELNRKAIKGMVEVEIVPTHDGLQLEGLAVPFEPRVEYCEASEPTPWTVVF